MLSILPPFFLSLRTQIPEEIQGIPETAVLPLPSNGLLQNGKWFQAFIPHPHAESFWEELETLLRTLQPGVKYGVLLQPEFSNGKRVTLGSSFLISN
jgi:hypothetical protein